MLDPLTALGLAGPVLQIIRFTHSVSLLVFSAQKSGDRSKAHDLRVEVFDTHTSVLRLGRLVADVTAADEWTIEQQAVRQLSTGCEIAGATLAEHLKQVSDSLNVQRSNPFAKQAAAKRTDPNIQIDFAKAGNYVQELRKLTELVASKITQSLAHTQSAEFGTISLREDVLKAGLSDIVLLLEYGGANVRVEDSTGGSTVQRCLDISTQARLDSLHSIEAEPLSEPLVQTRLRRRTILDLLHFRQISDRIEEVDIAYEKTLEWIFRDKGYSLAWSSFPNFLKSPSDLLYWINGKAGSGKSTLLRFLIRREKTFEHLRKWSGTKHLHIGHFFSWNLGATLQKTQIGLLQSLIYQVLYKDQTLIHRAFPDLWHDIDPSRPRKLPSLSFREIQHAFNRLINGSATKKCFCFFVDGIDEFDEDHSHVADLLLSFKAPNLKFILSSRPVDACVEKFEHCPKLRLQDLTADDIEIYIDGRLASHPTMLEVMHEEPDAAAELVHELKDRASGVFLWVKLVVTSLLTGLRKGDDINELKMRLRELPPDLSRLYASMLGKMDPSYSRQAAFLFYSVRTASILLDGRAMPTQFLAVAGQQFKSVVNGSPVAFETAKIVRWCKLLIRQLTSRCCGLLELSSSTYVPDWWHTDLDRLSQEHKDLLSSHVQFLHRTVTEYLYQDHVWDKIISNASAASKTRPYENLAYAALHMMKISPLRDDLATMEAYQWAQTVVRAAREVEREYGEPLEDLIYEMDVVLSHHISAKPHWSSLIEVEAAKNIAISHLAVLQRPLDSLLSFAAFVGLTEYVDASIERHGFGPGTQHTAQKIMLQALFSRSDDWLGVELRDRVAVVTCLLEHGANPNKTFDGPSVWQCCLQQLAALNCQGKSSAKMSARRRRNYRRMQSDAGSTQESTECTCRLEDVRDWSQLIQSCLAAGAKHQHIDYLAPFSQPDPKTLICCFSQLCHALYAAKNADRLALFPTSHPSSNTGVGSPVMVEDPARTSYAMTTISGASKAHLGHNYIYKNNITHVHHNYFGTETSASDENVSLPELRTEGTEDINRVTRSEAAKQPTNDFADILVQFKAEIGRTLRESPTEMPITATPRSTDLAEEDRSLIKDWHWRGEHTTFSDRRCSNPHCLTTTTAGWDYVPAYKGLFCLNCYQHWQRTGQLWDDTRSWGIQLTGEELFDQSFAEMSLTTTDDVDAVEHSDDDEKAGTGVYDTGRRSWQTNRIVVSSAFDDALAEPGSLSIDIRKPSSSAYDDPHGITSGTPHYLKSYRS